jgi:hypothetical protein
MKLYKVDVSDFFAATDTVHWRFEVLPVLVKPVA